MPATDAQTLRGPLDNWRLAVSAGFIAGAVFLMYEMIMMATVMGESPWGPPRMMAAILLGQGVLPPPATFSFGVVMVAMMLHFALSIAYAFILAEVVQRQSLGAALATGVGAGLLLYLINFYGFTVLFPWFSMARNWVSITGHALFGLVAAWAYVGLLGRGEARE